MIFQEFKKISCEAILKQSAILVGCSTDKKHLNHAFIKMCMKLFLKWILLVCDKSVLVSLPIIKEKLLNIQNP